MFPRWEILDGLVGGGFSILVGLARRCGLFTALTVEMGNSPAVKCRVGYTFR